MDRGRIPAGIPSDRCKGVFVRRAGPDDMDSIMKIEARAHLRPWSRTGMALELSKASSSVFWAACSGGFPAGTVTGYVCFRIIAPELYILNLAVDEEFRRRGIGSFMLSLCMRLGMARGADRVVLDVYRENREAVMFYRHLGFSFSEPAGGNRKIFSVMEMHFR